MTQSGPASFNPLAVSNQTLHTPLLNILADRIQREGPLTFAEWMDACLYHPQHGYYRRGKPTVGRDGDFLTSPEVHPLFGAAVGHVASELWRTNDRPEPFEIVEVGPGTGALAESLLRYLHTNIPEMATTTRYTLVEPDPASSRRQSQRLAAVHPQDRIHSVDRIDRRSGSSHLVVANELLDALPVHRLMFKEGCWNELLVDHSAAYGFHDALFELTDDRMLDTLSGVKPAEGQIVEIAPARAAVVTALANVVAECGLLLLFDYGYTRERLYASWRRDGTLMTFRNHIPGDDPYAHPGEQDITAHVDIDQIRDAALRAGLTALPTLSQAEWLHHLGAAVLPAVADANMDTNRYLAARRAMETLTDPAGLGRIAVMGFVRGSGGSLPGWTRS